MAGNLGELMREAAKRHGNSIAYQIKRGFRTERFTFSQIEDLSLRCARFLQDKGVGRGDRILFWSPNMPEYAIGYFACWLVGAQVVPLDVRTNLETLKLFVEASSPKMCFTSVELPGFPEGLVTGVVFLDDLLDLLANASTLVEVPEVRRDDIAEIAFTAGTTGTPKGVVLTHSNFLFEVEALNRVFPLSPSYRALSLLPLSHAFAQVIDLWLAFVGGTSVTFVRRPGSGAILAAMARYRITCMSVVPEILHLMLEMAEKRVEEAGRAGSWSRAMSVAPRLPYALRRLLFRDVIKAMGGKVQFFGCGSAPLDLKAARVWQGMGVRVLEGYGATETTAVLTINTIEHHQLGSVGQVLPGIEVVIKEEDEIWARGPNISPGYLDDVQRTEAAFVDGWHRTGDVGFFKDGYLYITGRIAFRIVLPNGQNVYPEDVERQLDQHPLVRESCVVGVRTTAGERVHAVIVTDHPNGLQDIVLDTNKALEAHQQISAYSLWPEPGLPRTAMLKIDRRKVMAQVDMMGKVAAPTAVAEVVRRQDGLVDILADLSEHSEGDISESSALGLDLGLDSLSLVEVLAAIEEKFGLAVDDRLVTASTTVAELRRIVDRSEPVAAGEVQPADWQLSEPATVLRRALQNASLFPIMDYYFRVEVRNAERLSLIPTPAIFVFNYQGPYAALLLVRILPPGIRKRTSIAVDARIWNGFEKWEGFLGSLFVNAFPFSRVGGPVTASLQRMGGMLDRGYSVIISPEGYPEMGEEFLPFHSGVGLMAVEMRAPVVPFRIDDYYRLFDPKVKFPWLPNKRGVVTVTVGEPVYFPRRMSYDEATKQVREALASMKEKT